MKFPSLMLTLIVLVLNIVPCCAWENSEENTGETFSQHEMPQEQHEDDCENCSPFYSCGNCTASLEIPSMFATVPQTSTSSPAFSAELLLSFTEGVARGIWQPPKLV